MSAYFIARLDDSLARCLFVKTGRNVELEAYLKAPSPAQEED